MRSREMGMLGSEGWQEKQQHPQGSLWNGSRANLRARFRPAPAIVKLQTRCIQLRHHSFFVRRTEVGGLGK